MTVTASRRMSSTQRREQLLGLAAEEFAAAGLAGASTEALARRAGITQAYVTRITAGLFEHITEGTNR